MKKLILFGAGKIGRSFIGQIFSRGGYEVVFIDVDSKIIDEFNKRGSYKVIIKSETGDSAITIRNVRGIKAHEQKKIIDELSECDLIATAVGQYNLKGIIPSIARGIFEKQQRGNRTPTDIILAENLRNAAELVKSELLSILPDGFPLEEQVGFVETSIGKMVPIISDKDIHKDVLRVYAEPYNTLILDKRGFRNALPDVADLAPKDNMKAWVDRKSFIHNLGHASAAYYGYFRHPEATYMWEVLTDAEVNIFTRETMIQSADALMAEYPDEFTSHDLKEHIEDLILRFQNKSLGDTVFRVGLDLRRKLGPQDRLVGAIRMAMKHDLPYENILKAIIYGFRFKATDEIGKLFPADDELHREAKILDNNRLLKQICGFNADKDSVVFKLAEVLE